MHTRSTARRFANGAIAGIALISFTACASDSDDDSPDAPIGSDAPVEEEEPEETTAP
jgi:hypothetical protein